MIDNRRSERVDFLDNCHLMYNGKAHKGILENMSTSGAAFKFSGKLRSVIPAGAPCSLMIDSSTYLVPGEFSGKVVYHKTGTLGLQFQF